MIEFSKSPKKIDGKRADFMLADEQGMMDSSPVPKKWNMSWRTNKMDEIDSLLIKKIRKYGERFPKKHGEWYRVHCYDDYYLLHDTWNGFIYLHKGCESSGTENMLGVVFVFSGWIETLNTGHMRRFWMAHINQRG